MSVRSLPANIQLPVAATLLVNTFIFGSGLARPSMPSDPVSFAPPGWVIGCVWMMLFVLFGAARWRLLEANAASAARWLTGFMVWALAYPLISAGFDPQYGQLANVTSLLFFAFVMSRTWRAERTAGLLLIPGILWLVFASILGTAILQSA